MPVINLNGIVKCVAVPMQELSVGDYYEDTVHGGRLWGMHVVDRSKIRAEADLEGGEGGLGKLRG